jgi:uncharacterized 2Fe-2S/4Fe-4S cluster protein (DUF4445 family)
MPVYCAGNCITCGKCAALPILGSYAETHSFEPREGFAVAIDAGTTTVVMALLDLMTGRMTARHSFLNPQRVFGPDVISRISASNDEGAEELRRLICGGIEDGMEALLKAGGLREAGDIVIAGNTAMIYMLLGMPCVSLGVSPFKPAYGLEERYELFGAAALIVPWFAAFVGGDVTAGLLHVLPEGKRRFMLIDLGTNGEMALYDRGKLTVCSAAAGPAFERGSGGASGTIRDLACLVRSGLVDETGLLSGSAESPLSQEEIRELQLAKSAVRSGIEILLINSGLTTGDLDAVYLAGGIGQAVDVSDAAVIGLLPPEAAGKTRAMGNASLGGAARLLLDPVPAKKDMKALLSRAEEINLASHPRFNELFVEFMGF